MNAPTERQLLLRKLLSDETSGLKSIATRSHASAPRVRALQLERQRRLRDMLERTFPADGEIERAAAD